uniref:C2H2-type domain-containing protein n=1 Tax=Macrostomum lignano TaxID=282301 RepID=A0A1I8GY55_9PLAT
TSQLESVQASSTSLAAENERLSSDLMQAEASAAAARSETAAAVAQVDELRSQCSDLQASLQQARARISELLDAAASAPPPPPPPPPEQHQLQQQLEFLNSVIVDLKAKNTKLERDLYLLTALPDSSDTPSGGVQHQSYSAQPPRLYCDICEEFDQHDTEDCPVQGGSSESPRPSTRRLADASGGAGSNGGASRPYCHICEIFGHNTFAKGFQNPTDSQIVVTGDVQEGDSRAEILSGLQSSGGLINQPEAVEVQHQPLTISARLDSRCDSPLSAPPPRRGAWRGRGLSRGTSAANRQLAGPLQILLGQFHVVNVQIFINIGLRLTPRLEDEDQREAGQLAFAVEQPRGRCHRCCPPRCCRMPDVGPRWCRRVRRALKSRWLGGTCLRCQRRRRRRERRSSQLMESRSSTAAPPGAAAAAEAAAAVVRERSSEDDINSSEISCCSESALNSLRKARNASVVSAHFSVFGDHQRLLIAVVWWNVHRVSHRAHQAAQAASKSLSSVGMVTSAAFASATIFAFNSRACANLNNMVTRALEAQLDAAHAALVHASFGTCHGPGSETTESLYKCTGLTRPSALLSQWHLWLAGHVIRAEAYCPEPLQDILLWTLQGPRRRGQGQSACYIDYLFEDAQASSQAAGASKSAGLACETCGKSFSSNMELTQHRLKVHSTLPLYTKPEATATVSLDTPSPMKELRGKVLDTPKHQQPTASSSAAAASAAANSASWIESVPTPDILNAKISTPMIKEVLSSASRSTPLDLSPTKMPRLDVASSGPSEVPGLQLLANTITSSSVAATAATASAAASSSTVLRPTVATQQPAASSRALRGSLVDIKSGANYIAQQKLLLQQQQQQQQEQQLLQQQQQPQQIEQQQKPGPSEMLQSQALQYQLQQQILQVQQMANQAQQSFLVTLPGGKSFLVQPNSTSSTSTTASATSSVTSAAAAAANSNLLTQLAASSTLTAAASALTSSQQQQQQHQVKQEPGKAEVMENLRKKVMSNLPADEIDRMRGGLTAAAAPASGVGHVSMKRPAESTTSSLSDTGGGSSIGGGGGGVSGSNDERRKLLLERNRAAAARSCSQQPGVEALLAAAAAAASTASGGSNVLPTVSTAPTSIVLNTGGVGGHGISLMDVQPFHGSANVAGHFVLSNAGHPI